MRGLHRRAAAEEELAGEEAEEAASVPAEEEEEEEEDGAFHAADGVRHTLYQPVGGSGGDFAGRTAGAAAAGHLDGAEGADLSSCPLYSLKYR